MPHSDRCRLRGCLSALRRCEKRSPDYDIGQGGTGGGALDAGTMRVFIEADAPRVACRP